MNISHFFSMLEKNVRPDTLFVPQLNIIGDLNASAQDQPEGGQIQAIISACLPDIEKPIIKRYLDDLNKFTPNQKRCLITMFFQVKEAYFKTKDRNHQNTFNIRYNRACLFYWAKECLKASSGIKTNDVWNRRYIWTETQFNDHIFDQ